MFDDKLETEEFEAGDDSEVDTDDISLDDVEDVDDVDDDVIDDSIDDGSDAVVAPIRSKAKAAVSLMIYHRLKLSKKSVKHWPRRWKSF